MARLETPFFNAFTSGKDRNKDQETRVVYTHECGLMPHGRKDMKETNLRHNTVDMGDLTK